MPVFFSLLFQFPDFAGQSLQIGLEVGVVLLYLYLNSAKIPRKRDERPLRTLGSQLRQL